MSRLPMQVDRLSINRAMRLLDEFRKGYPGITVDQAMTLLWIAAEPDSTQIEIAEKAGITRAAINRHAEVLGPPRNKLGKQVGADLIVSETDDVDRRKKMLRLTAQGERIVKSIQHLMTK